jgi:V/A-type H+-transporting ATPase subunit B
LGESALTELDKRFLEFSNDFEKSYVSQGEFEDRSIQETLDLGWKLMAAFPTKELKRIRQAWIDKYQTSFKKELGLEDETIQEEEAG